MYSGSLFLKFYWTACPLKIGLTGCPEMSVTNYQSVLHKIPDKHRYQLVSGLANLTACLLTPNSPVLTVCLKLTVPFRDCIIPEMSTCFTPSAVNIIYINLA